MNIKNIQVLAGTSTITTLAELADATKKVEKLFEEILKQDNEMHISTYRMLTNNLLKCNDIETIQDFKNAYDLGLLDFNDTSIYEAIHNGYFRLYKSDILAIKIVSDFYKRESEATYEDRNVYDAIGMFNQEKSDEMFKRFNTDFVKRVTGNNSVEYICVYMCYQHMSIFSA